MSKKIKRVVTYMRSIQRQEGKSCALEWLCSEGLVKRGEKEQKAKRRSAHIQKQNLGALKKRQGKLRRVSQAVMVAMTGAPKPTPTKPKTTSTILPKMLKLKQRSKSRAYCCENQGAKVSAPQSRTVTTGKERSDGDGEKVQGQMKQAKVKLKSRYSRNTNAATRSDQVRGASTKRRKTRRNVLGIEQITV